MRGAETRIVRGSGLGRSDRDQREFLVLIHGARLGIKIDLDRALGELIIGRDIDAGVPVDDDSVSRRHCRLVHHEGDWYAEDLGSTNGTYVGGEPITRERLRDGDLIKVGGTIFKFLSTANVEAAYHEEIYRMAIFDGLTQLHNRRYFEEFTDREIARSHRHGRRLSLLLFDVDHFKSINDGHGHLTGDYVLRALAGLLRGRIRREELLARYAGDEFVVVLPETSVVEAEKLAEMLRELVEEHRFEYEEQPLQVRISIGVGTLVEGMETPADLVACADAALYRAKERGRNRVSR